jgi:hypothetical protein
VFEKCQPDIPCSFIYDFNHLLAPIEASMYKEFKIKLLPSRFFCETSSNFKKTRRVLHMHARPEKSLLAEAASLRGASGKPSTWFPLGRHVQKDLPSSRLFLFLRPLLYISVLPYCTDKQAGSWIYTSVDKS